MAILLLFEAFHHTHHIWNDGILSWRRFSSLIAVLGRLITCSDAHDRSADRFPHKLIFPANCHQASLVRCYAPRIQPTFQPFGRKSAFESGFSHSAVPISCLKSVYNISYLQVKSLIDRPPGYSLWFYHNLKGRSVDIGSQTSKMIPAITRLVNINATLILNSEDCYKIKHGLIRVPIGNRSEDAFKVNSDVPHLLTYLPIPRSMLS